MRSLFFAVVLSLGLFSTTAQAVVIWDEGIDGDLSDVETLATPVVLSPGSNTVAGTIGGSPTSSPPDDFFDAFSFTLGFGLSVSEVNVVSYVSTGGNPHSEFNIFDITGVTLLGSTTFGPSEVGTNILPATGAVLDSGGHTIGIREGIPGQQYELEFVVIPEPTPPLLLSLALLGGALRRRR